MPLEVMVKSSVSSKATVVSEIVTAPAVFGPGTTVSTVRSGERLTTSPGAPPANVTAEVSVKSTPGRSSQGDGVAPAQESDWR